MKTAATNLKRAISKQDYDTTLETIRLRESTVGVIEERNAVEEHGGETSHREYNCKSSANSFSRYYA